MGTRITKAIEERMYAGVLGKALGVYFGHPVEGWSYEAIANRLGQFRYYPNATLGEPLIVPDDDISGTLVFCRGPLDDASGAEPTSGSVAATWLNYLIEDQTVLWWGGLARSTEHTAYLRLKEGIWPPQSGSIALNGASMAEGIGAQIFIDGWGLLAPGDPARAARYARAAAHVSHDGFAVDAAVFIASMVSAAFEESDLGRLMEIGLHQIQHQGVIELVTSTIARAAQGDWREVRDWIERAHGYAKYPGNSPAATNLAADVMALVCGGDSFPEVLSIVSSAGWDTDSNAGNVGCLTGVRLGLEGFQHGVDLRTAVADRLFVVSADGGECVTDVAREARKIADGARVLLGEDIASTLRPRFQFEYPGSQQGWQSYPDPACADALSSLEALPDSGLRLTLRRLSSGATARVAAPTSGPAEAMAAAGTSAFEVIASPTLYATQTVRFQVCPSTAGIVIRPFIRVVADSGLDDLYGDHVSLAARGQDMEWKVPPHSGRIQLIGLEVSGAGIADAHLDLQRMDWAGAPERFVLGRSYEMSPDLTPWTTRTPWLDSFVSSAKHLRPDYTTTCVVSHPEELGVATIGTADWRDYSVTSTITFNMQETAGLVARAKGHRRFYAAVVRHGELQLLMQRDAQRIVLASAPVDIQIDSVHELCLAVQGTRLVADVDGRRMVEAEDHTYASGAAGWLVERGSFLADGFEVRAIDDRTPTCNPYM